MISTVTTTTVSTVTAVALSASLGLGITLILLTLLIQNEALSGADGPRSKALGRVLNVAIVPLLIGFAFMAATKVLQVLR